MPIDLFRLKDSAILMAAVSAAFPVAAQTTNQAARVDFATPGVAAVGTDGKARDLGKGALVFQGDTIRTDNSARAQLRFTDGAQVSLQPQTEFRIEEYQFRGQADGSERGFFNLVRGGLRTITGLVGSQNRKNYEMRTSVATIGIRGTSYAVQYTNSIVVTASLGIIEACNAAGCALASQGQTLSVPSNNTAPQVVAVKADLPPAPPPQQPTNFVTNEQRTSDGQLANLPPPTTPTPEAPLLPLTGTGSFNLAISHTRQNHVGAECCFTDFYSAPHAFIPTSVTLNAAGEMIAFNDLGSSGGAMGPVTWPGPVVKTDMSAEGPQTFPVFGNDGIIAWGRWTGATTGGTGEHSGMQFTAPESLHYVLGTPTPVADISALASAGVTNATYVLIGATNPTNNFDIGRLNSASMGVNFVTGKVATTFNLTISSQTFNVNASNVSIIQSGFSTSIGAPIINVSSTGGACSCGCTASVEGLFAGKMAERAGYAYQVKSTGDSYGHSPHAVGVNVFKKQ